MSVDLSVVIPAFNEAGRLGSSLDKVLRYLEGEERSFEVIVVNDGSTDRTAEIAREYSERQVWLIELMRNRGKGAALRHGVVATRGRLVLLTDADLSTPIEEIERLEPRLREAEVVMGSRAVADSRVEIHQPRYRELMGKTFNVILRLLGLVRLKDTQCGFKLLDGEVARELFPAMGIDGFAYDVELVLEAERRGYRVEEVGVQWFDVGTSRVQPLKHSAEMFMDVLRLRFRRRDGDERRSRG